MKRLVVNLLALLIISMGSLFLSNAGFASANPVKLAEWQLKCASDASNYVCCTVDPKTGQIGDCKSTPKPPPTV